MTSSPILTVILQMNPGSLSVFCLQLLQNKAYGRQDGYGFYKPNALPP